MNKRNEIKADKYSTFVFIYLFLSFSAVSLQKLPSVSLFDTREHEPLAYRATSKTGKPITGEIEEHTSSSPS